MDNEKAKSLVNQARGVILLTHVSPDGDAIGSLLGMGHALRQQANIKTVIMVVDEGVPANLCFLPGALDVRADLNGINGINGAQAEPDHPIDLAIALDCSDEARMGNAGKVVRALGLPLIEFDHHPTNSGFGDVNLVNASAVAAAECILDWLDDSRIPIAPDAAHCLLCGIVTDTMCFRTNNVTATTLAKAQRLMTLGGDLSSIVQHTVSRMSSETLRLWGQVLPLVRIEEHVIWTKVTLEARRIANGSGGIAGGGDTKDGSLVSILLQDESAYISCVMTEKEDNRVELSFRAVPGFDVSKVAWALGGGGHVLASGATVSGAIEEVEARVIPLLKGAVHAGAPLTA